MVDTLAHALGAAERRGSVADKTSICDTEPEEQDKGHTLQSKVVHASKGGQDWNLIDTPGYPDFMAETISARTCGCFSPRMHFFRPARSRIFPNPLT